MSNSQRADSGAGEGARWLSQGPAGVSPRVSPCAHRGFTVQTPCAHRASTVETGNGRGFPCPIPTPAQRSSRLPLLALGQRFVQ